MFGRSCVAINDASTISAVAGLPAPSARGTFWRDTILNVYPFVICALIWEIVAWTGVFPKRLFPRLETVAGTFYDLTISGILPMHAVQTMARLLAGFIVAAIIG